MRCHGKVLEPGFHVTDTRVMRQAFAHEAVLLMEPHADAGAGSGSHGGVVRALGARAAMPAGAAPHQRPTPRGTRSQTTGSRSPPMRATVAALDKLSSP